MESLIFPALLLVVFYLMIIRPARGRQRAAVRLQEQLMPGVEVMTVSGIFGYVSAVEDDVVLLEVSPDVTLRVAKPAIGRIVAAETAHETADETADEPPADGPLAGDTDDRPA